MHVRRSAHHGDRQPREGRRLVRQRVGVLQPSPGPHSAHRVHELSTTTTPLAGAARALPQLEDLPDPSGKRVLLRADFNVPLEDGRVVDDMRIRAALPTIQWLQKAGAHVTACTHLGRPKGKPDPKYDVAPVRERLAELAPGVELLDNLRFDAGEEANDPAFVDRLVEGHDLYVNDAFGAAHRAHASVMGPPSHLPSAAGRLLAKEAEVLGRLLTNPRRPFVAVV